MDFRFAEIINKMLIAMSLAKYKFVNEKMLTASLFAKYK